MSVRFDEKGKYFTEIITKDPMPVIIQTVTYRVYGKLHVRVGERLKDEMNDAEQFLAVTEGVVTDNEGKEIYRSGFLVINRDHVVWLLPQDEMQPTSEGGEA